MAPKLPEIEDLTIPKERTNVIDVPFSAAEVTALQAEADRSSRSAAVISNSRSLVPWGSSRS